jgi:hypothetical protein
VIEQVLAGGAHAPARTAGTETTPFARKSDEVAFLAALALAFQVGEASLQKVTVDEAFQIEADKTWQLGSAEAGVDGGIQGADVVADHFMQLGGFRSAAFKGVSLAPLEARLRGTRIAGRAWADGVQRDGQLQLLGSGPLRLARIQQRDLLHGPSGFWPARARIAATWPAGRPDSDPALLLRAHGSRFEASPSSATAGSGCWAVVSSAPAAQLLLLPTPALSANMSESVP